MCSRLEFFSSLTVKSSFFRKKNKNFKSVQMWVNNNFFSPNCLITVYQIRRWMMIAYQKLSHRSHPKIFLSRILFSFNQKKSLVALETNKNLLRVNEWIQQYSTTVEIQLKAVRCKMFSTIAFVTNKKKHPSDRWMEEERDQYEWVSEIGLQSYLCVYLHC